MNKSMTLLNKQINNMSSRQTMLLPVNAIESRLDDLNEFYNVYKDFTAHTLEKIAESQDFSLKKRYVAGSMLALIGDPRIQLFYPKMLYIPGGDVEIGIDNTEVSKIALRYAHIGVKPEWIEKEAPKFNVHLSHFRISKYLVTNSEYYHFLKATKFTELPSSWEFGIYPKHKSNHPVYTVSLRAARAYTVWLSRVTKRQFRLPTEYEWEYAASGKSHYEFPWGNDDRDGMCNTVEEKIYGSTPVGIYPEGNSPFGAADMAGNVEEYVANYYHPYPKARLVQDDLYQYKQSYPVTRGGSFTRFRDLARCTRRHGYYPKDIYVIGFRLVEDI